MREEFWNRVLHVADRFVSAYEKNVALQYAMHPELKPVVIRTATAMLKPDLPPAVPIPKCGAQHEGATCTLAQKHPALDHWDETRQVEWPNPDKVPPPERVDAPVVTQGIEEMPDAMAAREAAEARARLEAETAPA